VEELFGWAPEHFLVHRGDSIVDESVHLGNSPNEDEDTLYVIDGDLTINGPLRFENLDVYTTLFVTGKVTARSLLCLQDSCLFIGGSLEVRELLVTDLTDAGHLVVHGTTSAGAWLEAGDRGCVEFAQGPKARRLRVAAGRYDEEEAGTEDAADVLAPGLLDGFVAEDPDMEPLIDDIWERAQEGQPLLRPLSPAGTDAGDE